MISRPAFWSRSGWLTEALAPLSYPYAAITARRVSREGLRVPVPVLCCGNATVGGAGKTTLTLELAHRLKARGVDVHILTRGYGGSVRGPHRVARGDTAATVGDEALLLAEVAPVWIGANRAATARTAIEAGARALLMDDGLQHPSLEKSMSLLVIDGATGFGNGKVVPLGPLREPVAAAASRCWAAVLIGPDKTDARALLPPGLPVLRARLEQHADDVAALSGHRVFAFAGLAVPEKFFAGLERAGVVLAGRRSFGDHHVYTASEIGALRDQAGVLDAVLVTTPKDAVRLPGGFDVHVVRVRLAFESEREVDGLLDELMLRRSETR